MLAEPGFDAACFVEWEPDAQAALIRAQRAGIFGPAPIWGDLTTFDGTAWRGAVDCVLAGYPCFIAGTLVLTDQGYRPIEEIAVGDLVLTHRGRWRPVTATMGKRGAPVRRIKAQGVPGVVCTDEHPFLTSMDGWTDACDLGRGARVAQVLPPTGQDERTPEFWWVVGRYLADGWRQWSPSQRGARKGRVTICCAHGEADVLGERIAAAGLHAWRSVEQATARFAITSHDLYEFLEPFGSGAGGKRLPRCALELDAVRARALCEGYLSGDGYRYGRSNEGAGWRATTVSKALALGFALLAQRAFGVVASVRRQAVPSHTRIEGREVNQREQFALAVPDRNRSGRIDEQGYGWKLVRSNEPCGVADVFNIAVDEDESYVADGAIVHNCQPFSAAGQRRGADDERHLWPDVARVIGEVSPRWVFLENVAGHLSLGLDVVLRDLRGLGFACAAGAFSAAETGAAHERLRVFVVAHSGDAGRSRTGGNAQPGGAIEQFGDGCGDERPERALADSDGEGRGRIEEFQPRRGADQGERRDDADGRRALGGHAGAEREQRGGEQRFHPEGGRAGGGAVGDASRLRRGEGRPEHGVRGWRDAASGAGVPVGDAGLPRREGREQRGACGARAGASAHGPASEPGRARLPLAPPGPHDRDGWAAVLNLAPDLAPALSLGDVSRIAGLYAQDVAQGRMAEAEAQSRLRALAHELSTRSRLLRIFGNGVHPLTAAHAWRSLSASLGLRPISFDGESQ